MRSPWWQFLKPKYWLGLPLFGLLALVAQFPYRWQYAIGSAFGWLLSKVDRKGVHTTQVNCRLAFPHLTAPQQQDFIRANYQSAGLSLIETACAWFSDATRFQSLLTYEGLEHLEAAQQSGRGILLASAHFGCLEIAGCLFAANHSLQVMYRSQKLLLLDAFAKYYRHKIYDGIIAREDLRGLIRTLKNGGIVWYTPDIDAGLKNSVFVPFFGIPTATLTTTSRLAAKTDAMVIPTFFYRQANAQGYRLVFKPPLTPFPSGDDLKDATLLNQVIEEAVRVAPTQYLWQYKRFKTRPNGEKRFY